MTNEEMLHEINALPLEAQRQIDDLIAVLRRRYESSPSTTIVVTDPLANEEFVGMWRDRDEMVKIFQTQDDRLKSGPTI